MSLSVSTIQYTVARHYGISVDELIDAYNESRRASSFRQRRRLNAARRDNGGMKVDYATYLQSPEWYAISEQVRGRARNRCERCKTNPISDIHHLTYERLGHERLSDLIALCRLCHKALHRIRDAKVTAQEERRVRNIYRYTGGRGRK